jgi:hypothetical protein
MNDSILAFSRGDWSRAIELARIASGDSNLVTDGLTMWTHGAIAGNRLDDLREAIERLRIAPTQERYILAALGSAEGGLAAREGRPDEARSHYRHSLDVLGQIGYWLEEATTSLEWGMLAGAVDPEAEAAGAAGEAFFVERDAAVTVERYRAAFAPVGPQATTSAATLREATAPARSGAGEG